MGGPGWRLAVVLGVAATALVAPLLAPSDYVVGVLARICLYSMLALGLNIVVGFAGLLDLGYVAFSELGPMFTPFSRHRSLGFIFRSSSPYSAVSSQRRWPAL